MNAADRVFRALLQAYPAGFRAAYAREMTLVFRDRRREPGARGVRFWTAIIIDIARTAPALRIEASRADVNHIFQPHEERKMKTMAILAFLIGALEVVNSLAEAWVGGIVLHGTASLVGGAIGGVAGALLLAAAVALLRRTPGAGAFAKAAAGACLAVFALIFLVRPMFSVLATMLGVGFPIALLIYLRLTQRRGPSVPTMA